MWSYEGDRNLQLEETISKHIRQPEVAKSLERFWSLYQYFLKNPPTSVSQLRDTVTVDRAGAIPFFSDELAGKIVSAWKLIQVPESYLAWVKARITRKKIGGATPPSSDSETIDRVVDLGISKATEKIGIDPANSRFGSLVSFASGIPARVVGALESNPYLGGPTLKAALDLFEEVGPKFILSEEVLTTLVATPLVPLFGAGLIIETIGFLVAEAIGVLTFLLSAATGKKGAAFLNLIQLIPFIGPVLRASVVNAADIYDRVVDKRPELEGVPVLGPFIYRHLPVVPTTNGGAGKRTRQRRRDRRRRRGTHKKPT